MGKNKFYRNHVSRLDLCKVGSSPQRLVEIPLKPVHIVANCYIMIRIVAARRRIGGECGVSPKIAEKGFNSSNKSISWRDTTAESQVGGI